MSVHHHCGRARPSTSHTESVRRQLCDQQHQTNVGSGLQRGKAKWYKLIVGGEFGQMLVSKYTKRYS